MANLHLYFATFWPKWWPVVSAFALFAIDPVVRAYWPWGAQQLDRLSAQTRRRIEISILIIAVFYAGFSTWLEEHESKIQLEQRLSGITAASGWQISADQKTRLLAGLKLSPNENYNIQINSAPNCDPCEEYAQELREFISSIPGWTAAGGPLVFQQPKFWRGLSVFTRKNEKDSEAVKKLLAAFSNAGLLLDYQDFEDTPPELLAIIVVGRRNR